MKDTAEDARVDVESTGLAPARLRFYGIIAGVAMLVLVALAWLLVGRGTVTTDNAYVKASKIQITSEVSGLIQDVHVNENELVAQDDPLFTIDPAPYRIEVDRLEAKRAEIAAGIRMKKARYAEKAIELVRAESRRDYFQRELDRQEALAERKVVSAAKLDEVKQERDFEQQTVSSIRQEMVALAADLGGDPDIEVIRHPSYLGISAELKRAQLNLERTEVRAPSSGVVSQVSNVRPGVYAEQGKPLFAIVETDQMWVEANLKETQLEHVRIGQPVKVAVSAYPDFEWEGVVRSFSVATGAEFAIIPPQNATGKWVKVTQRVPVRIELVHQDGEPTLVAGMSADVAIKVSATPRPAAVPEQARRPVYGESGPM